MISNKLLQVLKDIVISGKRIRDGEELVSHNVTTPYLKVLNEVLFDKAFLMKSSYFNGSNNECWLRDAPN